jgi:hypothetical protein
MNQILLNIDPDFSTLFNFILTGAAGIIGTLYLSMIKAKNEQIKEKDLTLEKVVAAKDENIIFKERLITESKRENETLQQQNIQLLAQVLPVLKTTQEVVKDISQVLREISKK